MGYRIISHDESSWEFNDESLPILRLLDFKWLDISVLGRSYIVKSFSVWFLVVPFIIKILDQIPESVSILMWEKEFTFSLNTPFPNQIYIFYFASVLFAMGNVIYSLRCPLVIKSYRGFSEYKEMDGSSASLLYALEVFCDSKELGERDREAVVFDFVDKYCELDCKEECIAKESWYSKLSYCRVSERQIANIFSHVRDTVNYLHRRSRQACALFYIVGIILVAYILCQNVYSVSLYYLRDIGVIGA